MRSLAEATEPVELRLAKAVRKERLEALKQAVREGRYRLDLMAVAAAMLREGALL